MLGELLENRYGPTSVSQQGAFCVPELVTVRMAPLRTNEISLACAMVTYALSPRVTSPKGVLTLAGMFFTGVAIPPTAPPGNRFTVSIMLLFSVITSWCSSTPTWAADPSATANDTSPSGTGSTLDPTIRWDSTSVVPRMYRWLAPKATLTGLAMVGTNCVI